MSLTSFLFIGCFIISVIIYYLIPKRFQWVGLLLFSAVFFVASCKIVTIIYLIINIITTKTVCEILEKKKSRVVLLCGLLIDIGMLAALKYTDFLISNLNLIFYSGKSEAMIPKMEWMAPIGISYYTIQTVAYILDVYWDITRPQKGFFKTALFVGYWPQLKCGPIARFSDMKDQLYCGHDFSFRNVTFGLQRMIWGIFKSLVISNRLGIMVDTIYGNTVVYNGFYIWFAAIAFMLQLYTDFSGCMDIVIGASECYGIILPENFRTPFFSRTVQEFWQRWHITLGSFMRDYVLNSILRTKVWKKMTKGAKKKFSKKVFIQLPSLFAMLFVWLLMGLWHGGGWQFVIGMGLWFWLCISIERLTYPLSQKLISLFRLKTDTFSWHLFQSLKVFVLVSIGNMFFRIDSLLETLRVMRQGLIQMNPWILFDGSLYELGISEKDFHLVIAGLFILIVISYLQEKYGSVRELIAKQNYVFRWGIYLLLIAAVIIYGIYGPGFDARTFIYERF